MDSFASLAPDERELLVDALAACGSRQMNLTLWPYGKREATRKLLAKLRPGMVTPELTEAESDEFDEPES